MEIAGHKQKYNIIIISRSSCVLLLLLLPLSYALFRTFGAPIYFVALINLPRDFTLSLSLSVCLWVFPGSVWHCVLWQDSVTCCMRHQHSHTHTHTHTHSFMHAQLAGARLLPQLEYYSFLLYFVALTTINCIKNAVIEYGQRR